VTVYIALELTNWLQIACAKFEAKAQTLGNVDHTKLTISFRVHVNFQHELPTVISQHNSPQQHQPRCQNL